MALTLYMPRHDLSGPDPGLDRTQSASLFTTTGATVVPDPFFSGPPYTH